MYLVTKQIVFETFDETNKRVIFEQGTELDYSRFYRIGKPSYLQIRCDGVCTEGPDFPIEDFIEKIVDVTKFTPESEKSINERFWEEYRQQADRANQEEPYTVQVEMINSRYNLNDYLKAIPGKNVIDIKPMENNCYLVIYKEYGEGK